MKNSMQKYQTIIEEIFTFWHLKSYQTTGVTVVAERLIRTTIIIANIQVGVISCSHPYTSTTALP
jgi:hypothetical protein